MSRFIVLAFAGLTLVIAWLALQLLAATAGAADLRLQLTHLREEAQAFAASADSYREQLVQARAAQDRLTAELARAELARGEYDAIRSELEEMANAPLDPVVRHALERLCARTSTPDCDPG